MLQAFPDAEAIEAIEAIEQFADGEGGYSPQLWSETAEPGRMKIVDANRHWCQPDFATTCLVRALRVEADLPPVTSLRYLEERFETRSGLYFANPYLVDWALARALRLDPYAEGLRQRLLEEILGGMNRDHSFGQFDVALSTSFAILALSNLGYSGRQLKMCQLRLAEMMEPRSGAWPVCTPFYSTFLATGGAAGNTGNGDAADDAAKAPQMLDVNGCRHELWLYSDTYQMIATAVAISALSAPADAERVDARPAARVHPRYQCGRQEDYIAAFALPAYVNEPVCGSLVQ
jgi:hypothetical protein